MPKKILALQYAHLFDEVVEVDEDVDAEDEARDYMHMIFGQEPEYINAGCYGEVYSGPEDSVFKIGNANDNSGYFAFLHIVGQDPANRFLPEFGQRVLFVNKSTGGAWFCIQMERLYDAYQSNVRRAAKDAQQDVNDFLNDVYNDFHGDDVNRAIKNSPVAYNRVRKALREIDSHGYLHDFPCLDVHDGNLMFRADGQLVFVDPLS